MQWYEVLVLVLGIVGSLFGIFGVSAYVNERMKHKASRKNKKEDDAEEKKLEEQKKLEKMRHDEYKAELTSIITSAIAPVVQDLESIKKDLKLVKTGVQVTCRMCLEDIADKAEKQKFLSAYDKQRFESGYQSYHGLGENGVMDAKRDRLLSMPEYKPTSTKKKSNKKQILVE